MVSTKHCCWGRCNNDSRYPERLPKSLKDMQAAGKKIFIPFTKPSQDIDKCKRWINACSREGFDTSKITRNTYICAVHWVGEKGPTAEHPDPLKANLSTEEYKKATALKRRAPKSRWSSPLKKTKLNSEDKQDSGELFVHNNVAIPDPESEETAEYISRSTGRVVLNKGSQTQYSKYVLSSKVETMIIRNEINTMKKDSKLFSSLSLENIAKNPVNMKHFTGLSTEQFEALYKFLNNVCPLHEIQYWNAKESTGSSRGNSGPESKISDKEKLFITLVRLRRGFTIQTMAILMSTPQRTLDETTIRKIFTTFIQLMYKIFRDMESVMFPSRNVLRRYLPKVFKNMKNIRCTVDCTEFAVQTSRNFARQGNTYSSYKHTNTFKCLIAVSPNGSACFVSDLYEGDIGDVELFQNCGILKHINPGDIILADRGFTVQELLNPLRAHLKIPAFLKGRKNLSAREKLETRKIAKARIHVERFNERLKQFRLIGKKIPLSLSPMATQTVVVGCGLVNFQTTLCK